MPEQKLNNSGQNHCQGSQSLRFLLAILVLASRTEYLLNKTCRIIDQRYPFFAAGKSVVFQTKFGAWISVSVKCHHEEGYDTYNRLHDISKIIGQRNGDSSFFCVSSTDFVDPRKDKWTSSSLKNM